MKNTCPPFQRKETVGRQAGGNQRFSFCDITDGMAEELCQTVNECPFCCRTAVIIECACAPVGAIQLQKITRKDIHIRSV
ncbi:hypothetical protein NJLHNGOC_07770 [Novacetimonas cocois]|uniref:Uncharacterized protein n=1 Tax=Novacetimonas cocois TaxID=1747507 RepID=A0A365YWP5_9PROT|nr:hypothetical protein NJLHNGOC_07770 [Novacetimonas cocois]